MGMFKSKLIGEEFKKIRFRKMKSAADWSAQ